MKELLLKKCESCGALVEVLQDCTCENCGIKCCGKEMTAIQPKNADENDEHMIIYKVVEESIVVKVPHPMHDNHYIEWIAMACDTKIGKKFLVPDEEAVVTFPYVPGSKVYAYCNQHGLWSRDVD